MSGTLNVSKEQRLRMWVALMKTCQVFSANHSIVNSTAAVAPFKYMYAEFFLFKGWGHWENNTFLTTSICSAMTEQCCHEGSGNPASVIFLQQDGTLFFAVGAYWSYVMFYWPRGSLNKAVLGLLGRLMQAISNRLEACCHPSHSNLPLKTQVFHSQHCQERCKPTVQTFFWKVWKQQEVKQKKKKRKSYLNRVIICLPLTDFTAYACVKVW